MNQLRLILGAFAAFSLGAIEMRAQTYTWTGGGPGSNWTTANNWDLGVPAQGFATNVFFGPNNPTAFTSTLDTSYTVGTVTVTANAGAFTLNNSGPSVLTVDSTITTFSPNAVTLNPGVAGGGNLFMFGAGTVTLNSASNTYSGLTRVTAGTLVDGTAGAFSPNTILTIASPGIVDVNFDETVAGLSDDFLGGNGSVVVANGVKLRIAGNNITTFSGVLSGLGGIEMDIGGMLTLSGSNNYSGNTTLNAGTLADGAANSFSPNSLNKLANAAALNVNFNETIGGLQGAGTVALAGGATLTDATQANPAFSGTIIGAGSLVIGGAGTQTLSGMSTYSGGTTVQSELFVGSSTNGPPGSFTAGPVGTGQLTFEFLSELSPSANVTLANAIFLNDDVQYVDNDDGGNNNLTLTGTIFGPSGLEWCTTGTLELTGANTFSGGLDMREGTLLLGSSTVGPPGSVTSGPIGTAALTLDNGTILAAAIPSVTFANAIDLTGNAQIGAGSSDGNALNLTGQISGSGVLTYIGSPTGSLTLSSANNYTGDTMINGGTVFAANNLAFGNAANTVVLNGGGLNVNSGVTISNTIAAFGPANPISGSGTIASPVTVNGAVLLSPGDPLGTLTFSSGLTLATNGSISFRLFDAAGTAGTGYSLFSVSAGTLSLTANPNTLSFNINTIDITGSPASAINFNPASGYSWMFATSASAIVGFNANEFDLDTSGFANATGGGAFSITHVGNNLFLNFTPVPEPSTWALLATGVIAAATFARSRRRRRRMRA